MGAPELFTYTYDMSEHINDVPPLTKEERFNLMFEAAQLELKILQEAGVSYGEAVDIISKRIRKEIEDADSNS